MIKIRIIAAIISIVLTALTLYLGAKAFYFLSGWMQNPTDAQLEWMTWAQVALGALVAVVAFWRWKKKRAKSPKG